MLPNAGKPTNNFPPVTAGNKLPGNHTTDAPEPKAATGKTEEHERKGLVKIISEIIGSIFHKNQK